MPASAVQDLIRLWEKDTKAEKCRGRITAHELIELTHSMGKEGRIIVAKWIVSQVKEKCVSRCRSSIEPWDRKRRIYRDHFSRVNAKFGNLVTLPFQNLHTRRDISIFPMKRAEREVVSFFKSSPDVKFVGFSLSLKLYCGSSNEALR